MQLVPNAFAPALYPVQLSLLCHCHCTSHSFDFHQGIALGQGLTVLDSLSSALDHNSLNFCCWTVSIVAGTSGSAPPDHTRAWDVQGSLTGGPAGTADALPLQPGLSTVLGGLLPEASMGLPGGQGSTNHSMNGGGYVPPAMIQHSRRGSAAVSIPLATLTAVGPGTLGVGANTGAAGGVLPVHGYTSSAHPGGVSADIHHPGGAGNAGGRPFSTSPSVGSHMGDLAHGARGSSSNARVPGASLNGGLNGTHNPMIGINGNPSNPEFGGARATVWPVSTERFCDQPDSEDEGGRLLRDTTGGYYNSTGQYVDPSGKYRRSGFRYFLRRLLCTCCMAD
jgi:hypothetical protein